MKSFFIGDREFNKTELELWAWSRLRDAPGWEKAHLLFILQWLAHVDFVVVHTSGSTGEPKPIKLLKKHMEASAKLTSSYFQLPAQSRVLLCLPSTGIAGKMMIARSLVNGWKLYWQQPSSHPQIVPGSHYDFAALTPMQVQNLLTDSREKFEEIKTVIIGGAEISPGLEKQIAECSNCCTATFAMTETCTHIAVRELNGTHASQHYHALPGVIFRQDERGCLCITSEYLGNIEIVTNDIVQLSGSTAFQFVGRWDNVINSGGVKLFPEKMEAKLKSRIAEPHFIIGRDDVYFGKKAVLYIEGWPWPDEKVEQLRQDMKNILQPTEVPKEIVFALKFERTHAGKIKRRNY